MANISFDLLTDHLIEQVPPLRGAYKELLRDWDGEFPGQHNVFEVILNPFLASHLRSGEVEKVEPVFALLEKMATHHDRHVREVLEVTVCEGLADEGVDVLTSAYQFMGPTTRDICHRSAVYWGQEEPWPDDPSEVKAMAPPKRTTNNTESSR
jgi:hypothetical protein